MRLIAINPTLRAECQRLVPLLDQMVEPAAREDVVRIVAREMPAWGVSAKHAAEQGVTYASYADALEGLSVYAIEEGVVRWNRGEGHKDLSMGGFPPRPAQLYALADAARREIILARYRGKKALEYVEKNVPRLTEEQRQETGAALRELLHTLGARKAENPMYGTRPRMTQAEMAARLRASAPEDPGDVV